MVRLGLGMEDVAAAPGKLLLVFGVYVSANGMLRTLSDSKSRSEWMEPHRRLG